MSKLARSVGGGSNFIVKVAGPRWPILGLLGLLFVGFKLAEVSSVKDWSWWLVTAPFWGFPALLISLGLILGVVALIILFIAWISDRYNAWKRKNNYIEKLKNTPTVDK